MQTSDLDYPLPPGRIAAHPAEPRDHSRLLVYHRATGNIEHRHFYDLPHYLLPTDLLIVNDTRVIPAKLELAKTTGAFIPGLFLHEPAPGRWTVLLRSRGKLKLGDTLLTRPASPYTFRIAEKTGDHWLLEVSPPATAAQILHHIGHTPLPPYIERLRTPIGNRESHDRDHYQTVYANIGASLAAPTAGLHFTPALLSQLEKMGIRRAPVTLEVGLGTFLPVETPTLEAHPMHTESYAIPPQTAAAIRAQRTAGGGRLIVVGTTAVRTLESAAPAILYSTGPLTADTRLLISPGYTFQLTDALITNFHLPKSTLIALVAAFIGLAKVKELYALAIRENYRFYSYGDAMLLL